MMSGWEEDLERCLKPIADGSAGNERITMSAPEQVKKANVRELVSPEEWQVRVDLAAAYRLVADYGWDDLVFTHISARVPGPEHHFLINPYGMMFEEITASSLVKVDLEGKIVMESDYQHQSGRLHDSQRGSCRA